jgi:hypothetical protein
MGWGIKHGESNGDYYMTDIAPTISALLHRISKWRHRKTNYGSDWEIVFK